jgi:hypothetical protein
VRAWACANLKVLISLKYGMVIHSFILWSVSRQVQSLFQRELSTWCDLELPPIRCEYPFLFLRSSSSFLLLLSRLPVTSIPPFIFPSLTCRRRQFLCKMRPIQLAFRLLISCTIFLCYGPGSSVNIATGYRLDGLGIEFRWGRDFPHLSRPALGPTQPPIQWVPGLSRG